MHSLLIELAALVGSHLKQRQWMISTAESCTGGLVASALTETSGSSLYFERGFITYSNLAKQQMLGVPEKILHKYGAISEQTARAMAQGALHRSNAQISLAITGIAGPGGGSIEKPVGTVCFGWALAQADGSEDMREETQHFRGNRHAIREAAVDHALRGVLKLL
ncbi:MAG: CinA family protein [Burkholderiaceae bacterium]|nr:CinA family protein [Burkholderiaceae bacterium]